MTHRDHVRLLENGIERNSGGVWADFGSGEGAFTLALRDIIGENGTIYSVDKNRQSLSEQEKQFEDRFPGTDIHFISANFTENFDLSPLDGIVAANSIHFEKNTLATIKKLMTYLKNGGVFIVVEYNVDHGNMWVPHPFSFATFRNLARDAGLKQAELLATIPSLFLEEIYSAKAIK